MSTIDHNNIGGGGGEGLAQQLIGELSQLRGEMAQAKAAIARAERRQMTERALMDAQCRDVRAAADAVEQRVGTTAEGPDAARQIAAAVEAVRRERPGLFAPVTPAGLGGFGAIRGVHESGAGDTSTAPTLAILRERAQGGDRASLLLYLKARRSRS